MSNYPATVNEVLDENFKYKKGVIPALRMFKSYRTGEYPTEVRLAGMRILVVRICEVYEVIPSKVAAEDIDGSFSGRSSYSRSENLITMRGKLSIITLLHELAHCIYGAGETQATRWSVNLYKRVYPEQYAKLNHQGHCLV